MPDDDLISVIDLATHEGLHKQTIFKVLKRHGIEPTKRRSANNRGQVIAYITQEEAQIVVKDLRSGRSAPVPNEDTSSVPEAVLDESGVFYLLALEPERDPGRFKVGFASSFPERLRQLRCSAPYTVVIETWPCKRVWEKTAIDCVAEGCEKIHTEVFRAASLDSVRKKCEKFFSLMPKLTEQGTESNGVIGT